MNPKNFFAELKRRNVYKVAVAYAVIAWLLIQAGSILFPTFEAPGWVMKVFVTIIAAGFVIALLISWAFEMTPQGMKRTGELSPNERLPYWSRRKFAAVMATLALAAAGLLVFQIVRAKKSDDIAVPTAVQDKSIAVLPLVNESGDASQEYFSDGLSEELINGLGQIRQLRVIGRNSSFQYKGKTADSRALGQALGVANLLEGSVRKDHDRVRISVSLVKTADGSVLWSHIYDRELKDIFAVQGEIARAVADQLRIALLAIDLPKGAQPTNNNLDAYNAYLRGEFSYALFSAEGSRNALEFFEEAIRLDPAFAEAHAGKAMAWNRIGFFSGVQGSKAFAEARDAAKEALKLKRDLARAHAALAYVHINADWDLAAAEAEVAQTDLRSPNVIHTFALVRGYQGRRDEAIEMERQAIALDPAFSLFHTNLGAYLFEAGRHDEAEQALHKAIDLQPQASSNHYYLALIAIARQQFEPAVDEAQREGGHAFRMAALAMAQAARQDQAAADAALAALIAAHGEDSPTRVADVYAFRQEADKTFEWLERAYAVHDPRLINLVSDQFLRRYRSDARFASLCQRVGLSLPE